MSSRGRSREGEAEIERDERVQRCQDLPDHWDLHHRKLACAHAQPRVCVRLDAAAASSSSQDSS